MTREMNKPDWHNAWIEHKMAIVKGYTFDATAIPRILDEDWKPFIDATNERFKQCGKQ